MSSVLGYTDYDTAIFTRRVFRCIDAPFEKIRGTINVICGYAGGYVNNPNYAEVSSGSTGHAESVQVIYDPKIVSYSELVDVFWKQFDPTETGGSLYDRGSQYKSYIFYRDGKPRKKLRKHQSKA